MEERLKDCVSRDELAEALKEKDSADVEATKDLQLRAAQTMAIQAKLDHQKEARAMHERNNATLQAEYDKLVGWKNKLEEKMEKAREALKEPPGSFG